MKEFRCKKCNVFLGEMTQGKLKKDTVLLCSGCYDSYKTIESLNDYEKGTKGKPNFGTDDFGKMFNDIINKGAQK